MRENDIFSNILKGAGQLPDELVGIGFKATITRGIICIAKMIRGVEPSEIELDGLRTTLHIAENKNYFLEYTRESLSKALSNIYDQKIVSSEEIENIQKIIDKKKKGEKISTESFNKGQKFLLRLSEHLSKVKIEEDKFNVRVQETDYC